VSRLDGTEVKPEVKPVTLRAESVQRAGFETFMLKEIHEQPASCGRCWIPISPPTAPFGYRTSISAGSTFAG